MDFTLGVEEEYQVIDPNTRELTSHEQKIVEIADEILEGQVKAEMHQAVVEVGTVICKDIKEVRSQVTHLRKTISEVASGLGLRIAAAGTHPFSEWEKQLITVHPRYDEIVQELQDAARSNLIFGLHVHVGIEDREMAIHIYNSVRYFCPIYTPYLPTPLFGRVEIQALNLSVPKYSINFLVPVFRISLPVQGNTSDMLIF